MAYQDAGANAGVRQAPWPSSSITASSTTIKPGVIPLRPLMLTDIFNAAINYVRVNPRTALGLTAIVVIIAQILVLLVKQMIPVVADFDVETTEGTATLYAGAFAVAAIHGLANVLLSGMLTVVVGRAVFGASITMGEAWQKISTRFAALIGLTVLQAVAAAALIGLPFVLIAVTNQVMPVAAVLLGFPLLFGMFALVVYLWTMVTFAPAVIVLERMSIIASIKRSFTLVRRSFWRVFGVTVLAAIVAQILALALSWPFQLGGAFLVRAAGSGAGLLGADAVSAVGLSIGEVIISPFLAGVVVLLYTDRRMRAEAFDLVLQTGAGTETSTEPDSTDHLWQIRQP